MTILEIFLIKEYSEKLTIKNYLEDYPYKGKPGWADLERDDNGSRGSVIHRCTFWLIVTSQGK